MALTLPTCAAVGAARAAGRCRGRRDCRARRRGRPSRAPRRCRSAAPESPAPWRSARGAFSAPISRPLRERVPRRLVRPFRARRGLLRRDDVGQRLLRVRDWRTAAGSGRSRAGPRRSAARRRVLGWRTSPVSFRCDSRWTFPSSLSMILKSSESIATFTAPRLPLVGRQLALNRQRLAVLVENLELRDADPILRQLDPRRHAREA